MSWHDIPMQAPDEPPVDTALRHLAIEHIPDAVIVSDRDGIIRGWNPAAERLFGFSRADAQGRPLDLIIPERLRRAHDVGFRDALAAGRLKLEGRVMTTRANHRAGDRLYVDFTMGLVRDDRGQVIGVVAVGRDATARQLEAAAARQAPGKVQ